MRKAIFLLPVLAAAVAAPAHAQVTGRAELKVGYDELRSRYVIDRSIRPEEFGVSGVAYGAELGADYNAGGLLFGVYGGIDLSQADGCEDELFFEFDETCLESDRNLYAGARVGLRVGDSGAVYVKGGLSRGRIRATYNDGEDDIFSERDTVNGYHLGAGAELDVARNVYVKGEYIYTKYKDAFTEILEPEPEQDFAPTRHQLMFGVGLRFGAPAAPPPVDFVPPPPPPPAAPATQTCPNGSVILATDVCPLPPAPPPPPPPPPAGERG